MKADILDDRLDTLRILPSFDRLQDLDVTNRHDHADERQALFLDIHHQMNANAEEAPVHMIDPEVREGR